MTKTLTETCREHITYLNGKKVQLDEEYTTLMNAIYERTQKSRYPSEGLLDFLADCHKRLARLTLERERAIAKLTAYHAIVAQHAG